MKEIRWGIIGCGDVTEVKSGPAFNRVPGSTLVAVMRRDAAKAADYASRHHVPKWYSDAHQLITDPEVNAIYVATPPQSHESYTLQAIQAGKPVYVEKPMAMNAAEAIRMRDAAIKANVALCVAHYRKEQPRFRKVKELLDAGAIGEVRMATIQLLQAPQSSLQIQTEQPWRLQPSLSGGGLFHDLSPHQLDLMQFFFGPVEKAFGHSRNQAGLYPAADLVTGTIIFQHGVVCTGAWCFTVAQHEAIDQVTIIGSAGSIRFHVFSTQDIIVSRNGNAETLSFPDIPHVQEPMIAAVTRHFWGEGPNPSTADSAVETMQIIDAFTQSSSITSNINH